MYSAHAKAHVHATPQMEERELDVTETMFQTAYCALCMTFKTGAEADDAFAFIRDTVPQLRFRFTEKDGKHFVRYVKDSKPVTKVYSFGVSDLVSRCEEVKIDDLNVCAELHRYGAFQVVLFISHAVGDGRTCMAVVESVKTRKPLPQRITESVVAQFTQEELQKYQYTSIEKGNSFEITDKCYCDPSQDIQKHRMLVYDTDQTTHLKKRFSQKLILI